MRSAMRSAIYRTAANDCTTRSASDGVCGTAVVAVNVTGPPTGTMVRAGASAVPATVTPNAAIQTPRVARLPNRRQASSAAAATATSAPNTSA